jgi:hypothetical protein
VNHGSGLSALTWAFGVGIGIGPRAETAFQLVTLVRFLLVRTSALQQSLGLSSCRHSVY